MKMVTKTVTGNMLPLPILLLLCLNSNYLGVIFILKSSKGNMLPLPFLLDNQNFFCTFAVSYDKRRHKENG